MNVSPRSWPIIACVLTLAGCVSTPARRIAQHAEWFASFPPEIQENVKQGRIRVGYTQEMVMLALGAPRRAISRTTAEGQVEVWIYTDVQYVPRYEPVPSSRLYRDASGKVRETHDWTWVDVGHHYEYETLRVEFTSGKVSAIESLL